MKKAIVIIMSVVLAGLFMLGCQTTGVPPEQLQNCQDELTQVRQLLAQEQDRSQALETERDAAEAELAAAQEQIVELHTQLKQQSLTGSTPAETAEKIVKYYHDTHVYSTYDLFICSDMASEIWNMLKAQGISSVVAVGDIDAPVSEIVLSNHAWVLAEVEPGTYLALETTGGYVVPETENPLYYRGWSFDSPAKLKKHNELIREYNVRVGIHNELAAEERKIVDEYNGSTSQSQADKLLAVHEELMQLIESQQSALTGIAAELDNLARVIQ
jgi:outer membrane murein-binding lipoprotein Lpp